MIRRRALALLIVTLAASSACAPRETHAELELGRHHIKVSAPAGWEVLDQGAQKRFRKGEADIVMQNLGKVEWDPALASLQDDERREVKSRRMLTIDNHDAMDIETWNRFDHSWPQRLLFIQADDDLLAIHTTRQADPDTVKAFDSIRESLHLSASVRR